MAIEYRFADNQMERLPELAAELVHRQRRRDRYGRRSRPAFAAKGATATIPIVFTIGDDPVRLGLVASLARPGGNMTGISFLVTELAAKRLALLRELVPAVTRIAVFVNPAEATNTEATMKDVETAARVMGLEIERLNASRQPRDQCSLCDGRARATRRHFRRSRHLLHRPARPIGAAGDAPSNPRDLSHTPEYAEAGGLMSYGTSLTDAYRQAGVYTGRILKGANPVDLPVARATKFELVINAETARMLGIAVPPSLLATADEVIE